MQLRFKQLINGYANCPFPTPSVTQRMQGKKWPGCKLTENINKNKPHKANMWQPNRLCRLQQYYQKQYVCLSVCLKSNSIRAFLPPLKLYFMTISHWLVTGRMATLPCTQRPQLTGCRTTYPGLRAWPSGTHAHTLVNSMYWMRATAQSLKESETEGYNVARSEEREPSKNRWSHCDLQMSSASPYAG